MALKLTNQELFHFCEQFSIILHSGMPSVEGLRLLMEDAENKEGKDFMESLLTEMEMSGDLSETLKKSGAFPDSMVSYVRLGEHTGCLDEVMTILTKFYQQEIETAEQIRSAVTYPLIMLGMMAVVIVILLMRVLPVFSQVFRQMGIEMTGISASLMGMGISIQRYSYIFFFLIAVIVAFVLYFCLHPKGKQQMNELITRLPYFREIPSSMDCSRMAQGISMGLRSGLSPEDSMEMAIDLVTTPEIREKLQKAVEKLRDGESFSESIMNARLFGGMEARLITIGFQSGSADDVMQRLSERYQENSIALISQAISILEPTIVIILTVLVGLVLLSVMIPLLGILSELMA